MLCFQMINEKLELFDDRNIVSIPAIKIFAFMIKGLIDHFGKNAKGRNLEFKPKKVLYVLTVPAIWSESAKEFMKKAALQVSYIQYFCNNKQMHVTLKLSKYFFKIKQNYQYMFCHI